MYSFNIQFFCTTTKQAYDDGRFSKVKYTLLLEETIPHS